MKRIILFCLCYGCSFLAFGQNKMPQSETVLNQYQVGFNVSSLWKKILNRQSSNLFLTPSETITFKNQKNGRALRAGIGFNYQRNLGDENSNNNFNSITRNTVNLRLGYEKQKIVSERWLYYYGLDLKYINSVFKINSFSYDPKFQAIGIAPILGFQFRLTKRLFLQTEASVNFLYSTFSNMQSFFNFPFVLQPEDFFIEKGNGFSISTNIPNFITLAFEF